MPELATRLRWLMVVRRDRADLFANLKRAFPDNGSIEPILDRRLAERRAHRVGVERERRRRSRRRRPPNRDLTLWEAAGFRLVELTRSPAEPRQVSTEHQPAPDEPARGVAAAAATIALRVDAAAAEPVVTPIPIALQPALPGLAALVGSLTVPDGATTRLTLVGPWLEDCVRALQAERLDLCRSYLALALRTLQTDTPNE
ncbi:MAG TPA: hypothetical protein VLD61_08570 [Methylomirabilota bacterium]|nr:hypothetical protein [Methylomirabilota bacterium]